MIEDDDYLLECLECGHFHRGYERVSGDVNEFGMLPILCPKCHGESYIVIAARETK